MNATFIASLVRHGLTLAAGALAAKGVVDASASGALIDAATPVLTSAAMTGVSLVWSWVAKRFPAVASAS
jgi:short subunit fatty acids transporter